MIDANQQGFWMLSEKQLSANAVPGVVWDSSKNVLRFKSRRDVNMLDNDHVGRRDRSISLANQAPVTFDAFETWASLDETGNKIIAGGVFNDENEILDLPEGESVIDMAMCYDGVLYAIVKTQIETCIVYLINRRGSREAGKQEYVNDDDTGYEKGAVRTFIPEDGGMPDRVVALAEGGALLLNRKTRQFWQITGEPQRAQPVALHYPHTPRPCDDYPPGQKLIPRNDLKLPSGFRIVAMATSENNEVAILLNPQASNAPAELIIIKDWKVGQPCPLESAFSPFSIGWVRDSEWALLFENLKEAIVYNVPWVNIIPSAALPASGRRYPLYWGADEQTKNYRLCNAISKPCQYVSLDKDDHFILRPLHALSYPSYTSHASLELTDSIDSGEVQTVWHRIYLEACIPNDSAIKIFLAAADTEQQLNDAEWHEHHFGSLAAETDVPRAAWIADRSEVPFFPGLLYCETKDNIAGLFSVLIQRHRYQVRSLTGRFLKVCLELQGNGYDTPEIAAIRFYGPRFSYLNHYLPELYHETQLGSRANEKGNATGPDFLQRMLCLFESVLTPLEDKMASVHLLSNPQSIPEDGLDWLAKWLNVTLHEGLAETKKRRVIEHATKLYRKRGTMEGLGLALDLVTDEWVSRGDIVLLEDFRLRRTFATILGADLGIEDDSLFMDDIPNSNSFLGDTLILGDDARNEFLLLYSKDFIEAEKSMPVVEEYYERFANRLTVLVHQHTSEEDFRLIRHIVSEEVPSHIDYRIVPASKPLLIGLYSLVGVDTYLQKEPMRQVARLGHSYLGDNDFIQKLPVLDDRLEP